MRRTRRNEFDTNNVEVTVAWEFPDTEEIEWTVKCDFDFDGDDKEVGYYGHGWKVCGVGEEIWFTNESDNTPQNIARIKEFMQTKKFDELAIDFIQNAAEQWYAEQYGE